MYVLFNELLAFKLFEVSAIVRKKNVATGSLNRYENFFQTGKLIQNFFEFQVKAFVSQVEQNTKQQLKSKPLWISTHENSVPPGIQEYRNSPKPEIKSSKKSSIEKTQPSGKEPMMENSKNAVLVASRKPSAVEDHMRPSAAPHMTAPDEFIPAPPPPIVAKPQFYFGQTMTDLVKKSSASNGYQTAIDKVKQNEALTHPKRSDEQQKVAAVTELNKKGRHMSIITMAEDKNKDLKGGSSLSSGLFTFCLESRWKLGSIDWLIL